MTYVLCLRSLIIMRRSLTVHHFFFFFFNDTATTEIYTLSLHDALPIYAALTDWQRACEQAGYADAVELGDRKSTRLNSSHLVISYAVFCLKKKKKLQFQFSLAHNTLTTPILTLSTTPSPCM